MGYHLRYFGVPHFCNNSSKAINGFLYKCYHHSGRGEKPKENPNFLGWSYNSFFPHSCFCLDSTCFVIEVSMFQFPLGQFRHFSFSVSLFLASVTS